MAHKKGHYHHKHYDKLLKMEKKVLFETGRPLPDIDLSPVNADDFDHDDVTLIRFQWWLPFVNSSTSCFSTWQDGLDPEN